MWQAEHEARGEFGSRHRRAAELCPRSRPCPCPSPRSRVPRQRPMATKQSLALPASESAPSMPLLCPLWLPFWRSKLYQFRCWSSCSLLLAAPLADVSWLLFSAARRARLLCLLPSHESFCFECVADCVSVGAKVLARHKSST